MRLLLALVVLLGSVSALATSPSRKLFCKDVAYQSFLVVANITKGEISLRDLSNDHIKDRLTNLEVDVKTVGQRERITFKQDGSRPEIPEIVFTANVDRYGEGSAKSYNDLVGGTSKFKCGIENLDLN